LGDASKRFLISFEPPPEFSAVIVSDCSQQADIEPTNEHPFFRQFDAGRRLALRD
jgi:hypothetical protein